MAELEGDAQLIVLIYLLAGLSFLVFLFDKGDLSRIPTLIMVALAAVAISYVATQWLPRSKSLISINKLISITVATIALSAIESGAVFYLDWNGHSKLADSVDTWSAVIVPCIYIGMNVYSFSGPIRKVVQGNRVRKRDQIVGLADRVRCCGHKLPRYAWFMLSGSTVDFLMFSIDRFLMALTPASFPARDSTTWAVSFGIAVIFRHATHTILVFGQFEGSYWNSLSRTYAAYSSVLVATTLTNWLLISVMGLAHTTAWICTMLWSGVCSYFLLKKSWRPSGKELVQHPSAP